MRRGGYTLLELMLVVALVGILAAHAVPRWSRYLDRVRVQAALERFAGDVARARMTALREGARVELELVPAPHCPGAGSGVVTAGGYRIRTAGEAGAGGHADGAVTDLPACLGTNNDAVVSFNSRGLLAPYENRTVWAERNGQRDTITVSVLGRVYRRY